MMVAKPRVCCKNGLLAIQSLKALGKRERTWMRLQVMISSTPLLGPIVQIIKREHPRVVEKGTKERVLREKLGFN